MKWFIDFLVAGNIFFMFPMTVLLAGILVLFVIGIFYLFRPIPGKRESIDNLILALIYIGGFSAIFGIFGQGIGLFRALKAIEEAADVSFGIMVHGFKLSMIAPLYGTFIFLLASILWFLLKTRYNILFRE